MFNLRRSARSITQLYDDLLRPTGLRATQFSLLRVLAGRGPMTVTELGEFMGMDRTTVTRNVKVVSRMRFLAVEPGADRRTRVVRVTHKGRAAVKAALPYWKKAQKIVVDGLGTSRWNRLRSELDAVSQLGADALEARSS